MSRGGRWVGAGLALGLIVLVAVAIGVYTRDAGAPTAGAGEAGTPILRVDHDRIDLGNVPLGEWVEAQFVLTNAGDGRLRLTAAPYVRAVAGC